MFPRIKCFVQNNAFIINFTILTSKKCAPNLYICSIVCWILHCLSWSVAWGVSSTMPLKSILFWNSMKQHLQSSFKTMSEDNDKKKSLNAIVIHSDLQSREKKRWFLEISVSWLVVCFHGLVSTMPTLAWVMWKSLFWHLHGQFLVQPTNLIAYRKRRTLSLPPASMSRYKSKCHKILLDL